MKCGCWIKERGAGLATECWYEIVQCPRHAAAEETAKERDALRAKNTELNRRWQQADAAYRALDANWTYHCEQLTAERDRLRAACNHAGSPLATPETPDVFAMATEVMERRGWFIATHKPDSFREGIWVVVYPVPMPLTIPAFFGDTPYLAFCAMIEADRWLKRYEKIAAASEERTP